MAGITHAAVVAVADDGTSPVGSDEWNAEHVISVVAPTGLTGATGATRYVGGTASGAPVTGTFSTGDWVVARDGKMWVCTSGGSPGTWVNPNPGGAPWRLAGVKDSPSGIALGAYGDELEYSSVAALTGVWTPHGSLTYRLMGSSILLDTDNSSFSKAITVPTNCEIAALLSDYKSTHAMCGIGFVDSTGMGPVGIGYQGNNYYIWKVTNYISEGGNQGGGSCALNAETAVPFWLVLRKQGTTYRLRVSPDLVTFYTVNAGAGFAGTMVGIVFGHIYGGSQGLFHRVIYGTPDLGLG